MKKVLFLAPFFALVVLVACNPSTTHTPEALNRTRADWLVHRQASGLESQCQDEVPTEVANVTVHHISDNQAIVQFICNIYAYQADYALYNVHFDGKGNESVTELSFGSFEEGKQTHVYVLMEPIFDADNGVLESVSKGRGLGDCGSFARYEWREDIGGFFDLLEFRWKENCDGEASDPESWPLLFERGEPGPAEGHSA